MYMMFNTRINNNDESPSTCSLDIESDFASSKPKSKAKALALCIVLFIVQQYWFTFICILQSN